MPYVLTGGLTQQRRGPTTLSVGLFRRVFRAATLSWVALRNPTEKWRRSA